MNIRYAEIRDLVRINDIYNEAVRTTTATFDLEPQSMEFRMKWFAAHDNKHPVWVAEENALGIVGWAALSEWSPRGAYGDTASLSIYIESSARGKGLGRRFLETIDCEAPALGLHTLIAGITAENSISIDLHKKLGFELAGTLREVGFKFGRRHDVLLYQKIYPAR